MPQTTLSSDNSLEVFTDLIDSYSIHDYSMLQRQDTLKPAKGRQRHRGQDIGEFQMQSFGGQSYGFITLA